MNLVTVVGRLAATPMIEETEGKKKTIITLAIPRTYKNINGEYEIDFIDCVLWNSVAENTSEYCKKGDVIGIKGRIQTRYIENEEGMKIKIMEIVAEKVTFLSSGKGEEI